MFKICVQTIDGDVGYFDINNRTCTVLGSNLTASVFFLESMYPEYRFCDLIISFVWVKDGE